MKCKQCGGAIVWKRIAGSWNCYNAGTQVDHWDTCSQRRFARIKATGTLFSEQRGEQKITGYKTHLKKSGEQQIRNEGFIVTGSLYNPSGDCAECCEPWEVCSWPCPDAIP